MSKPVIDNRGTQIWRNEYGQYHRENGPSLIEKNGNQVWFINGEYHRTDGPAVTFHNKKLYWYINGIRYFNNKSFQKAANLNDEDIIAIILKYGDI
jgi:hypothetical protein